jgi:reelin
MFFFPCRAIRFRWYQGYLNGTYGHLTPQWAIRNVILSPQCPELCNGHGRCTEEGSCECDGGYQGDACETVTHSTLNPHDFHESFITAGNDCKEK